MPDLVQETLRAGARAAKDERYVAHGHGLIALEVIHHEGPIDRRSGWFADPFIVNVTNHTDDFPPVVLRADTDAFAERAGGIGPILTSQTFRHHGDRDFPVGVVPGDSTAGHQRCAKNA